MAKSSAVWGIDIGRCALKALRCRMDGDAVVADGFDYIEYPKLLTPARGRRPAAGERSARAVPLAQQREGGQGRDLASRANRAWPVISSRRRSMSKRSPTSSSTRRSSRFPSPLEDVIWDYQRMAGGQEVDGFALDTEIGLFAMKREQVAKALHALQRGGDRGRHHPARADRDLQLHRATTWRRSCRKARSTAPKRRRPRPWSSRSAPTRPTWW